MLGAFRQFGARQALRAFAPRSLSARWGSQTLWQPLSSQSPLLSRSFHKQFPALQSSSSQAVSQSMTEESTDETAKLDSDGPVSQFIDLQTRGLVHPTIIRNITHPTRMGLVSMTEVQKQTVHQMLQGDDV